MKPLFIEYPKCTTCQKAKKCLKEMGIAMEERHIVEDTPTYDELKEWIARSDLPIRRFFNTSGNLYKEMNLKDKLSRMTEEEKLKLLSTSGMLVRRPLVIAEQGILIGFKEKEWDEFFLDKK